MVVGVVDVVCGMKRESGIGGIAEVGEGVFVAFPSLEDCIVHHAFFI